VEPGSVLVQVGAFDKDTISSNRISLFRYDIVTQQPSSPLFIIEPLTGRLSIEGPGFNRESFDAYNLTISVSDQGNIDRSFCLN